jgi:hypothetical protein
MRGDGRRLYRFCPMPTRQAIAPADAGPQHAVLASVLHRKIVDQTRLDLRFPCATSAILDGVPGVLVDDPDPSPPDAWLSELPAAELQRAVLAQWVLGRPGATWSDVNFDEQTRLLRPRRLLDAAHEPLDIARDGLRGMPPLLFHPATGEPIPALHRPLDAVLGGPLRSLDLQALAKEMTTARDLIDLRNSVTGVTARANVAASREDAVPRLLEPLRALQTALRADPELPLAKVLVDAAEELSLSPHQ